MKTGLSKTYTDRVSKPAIYDCLEEQSRGKGHRCTHFEVPCTNHQCCIGNAVELPINFRRNGTAQIPIETHTPIRKRFTRCSFGLRDFPARSRNDLSQINVQCGGYFQNRFQSGVPFPIFHIRNHLWRQTRFLGNEVFRQLAALALSPKKQNHPLAKYLCVSIHRAGLQENEFDSAFHYGGIAPSGPTT